MRLTTLLVLLVGCGDAVDTGDSAQVEADPWEALLVERPGVLLSVWGRSADDVWTVGADGGEGPEVHHWDGHAWTSPALAVSGDLWWVTGTDDDTLWMSGSEGKLLRFAQSQGEATAVETDTSATLFGVWGPSDDLVYAVGAVLDGGDEEVGVVLRVVDGIAEPVRDLPATVDPAEMYFKVWGTSASELWVVGDRGSLLHFDGSAWSRTALPDQPRLVTLSGSSSEDLVVVGGAASGLIYQREGAAWRDVSPAASLPLNGVFVRSDGSASAVGMSGATYERVGGAWARLAYPDTAWDWHGAWIDEQGRTYAAGGDFFGLSRGALYRHDPAVR